jgi:biopolymer transport protein TolR
MGAALAGGSGRGRRGGRRRGGSPGMSEINITPFVDVMLVLLIIFMVAAPLMTVSVPIDLPQASSSAPAQANKPPLTVSVKKNGDLFLMDTQIQSSELLTKLQALAKNGADERIYVRGDAEASYQSIMDVLTTIKNGGFPKVALVATEKAGK